MIGGGVGVVAAVAILASACGGGGDDQSTRQASAPSVSQSASAPAPDSQPAPAPAAEDPLTSKDWTISDIQFDTQYGMTGVTATVTNKGDKARTGVFTLTFSQGGKRVASVTGSANETAAGESVTTTFVASSTEIPGTPDQYDIKFQTDMTS